MAIGIVLGGGGTLGDFQVGALTYLYDTGVLPNISCVCGTSIGAINAVIVSIGKDCDKHLKRFWSEDVVDRNDLIPQHFWSEDVEPILRALIHAEKHSKLPMHLQSRLIGRVRAMASLIRESKGATPHDIMSGIDDLEDIFGTLVRESALYTMDAIKQRMQEKIDVIKEALDSNIVFCLYATNVETGQKTCFTNNTNLVGRHGDTCYVQCHTPSMLIEAALASAAVPVMFPPVAVKFPHGEMCGTYYIDGGVREIVPVKGAIACKATKIYAILCLPRFGQKRSPSAVGKQKYAFLDLKDAKGQIVSTDRSTSNLLDIRPGDWVMNNRDWNPRSDECDVLDVANRAGAIVLDELTDSCLVATDANGEVAKDETGKDIKPIVIDPLIPVHGCTQLNIGLLKINADQGYMRAFDVVSAGPIEQQCEELTAEITARRIKIWALEHKLIEDVSETRRKSECAVRSLLGAPCVPRDSHHCCENVVNTKILRDIRQMKEELKKCIDRRLAIVNHSSLSDDDKKRCLPEDYVCMYLCWEPHNWSVEGGEHKPLTPSPWHKFDLGEFGSDVIEESWSLGHPPLSCTRKSRSLLDFRLKSHQVNVA